MNNDYPKITEDLEYEYEESDIVLREYDKLASGIYEDIIIDQEAENAVRKLFIEQQEKSEKKRKQRGGLIINVADLEMPEENWHIDTFLPAQSLVAILGDRAAGKSAFIYTAMMNLAMGESFLGMETKKASVLLFVMEGFGGALKRFIALRGKQNCNLFLCSSHFSFESEDRCLPFDNALNDFHDKVGTYPDIIVIDTVACALGGSDENSDGMRNLVAKLNEYRAAMDNTIIVLHHMGHSNKDRARGHSSFEAAMDCIYKVEQKKDKLLEVTCLKMKDYDDDRVFEAALVGIPVRGYEGLTAVTVVPSASKPKPIERRKKVKDLSEENETLSEFEKMLMNEHKAFLAAHPDKAGRPRFKGVQNVIQGWLKGYLAEGPRTKKDVVAAAIAFGINKNTIYKYGPNLTKSAFVNGYEFWSFDDCNL